jgi:hypothetical protein
VATVDTTNNSTGAKQFACYHYTIPSGSQNNTSAYASTYLKV